MNARTAALILLLLPGPARGDAIDRYVEAELRRQKVPGLSLAIVKAGKVVEARGYGLANVEHRARATADTVYQSGSLGKPFTAALVLMLVEEGKLGLDDPVCKHLPGAPKSWAGVTLRHLLTRTSGLPDYSIGDMDYRADYTEERLLSVVARLAPEFAPGSRYAYSNTGYALLGMVIRKATGKFHGDFLRERILLPL